MLPVVNYRYSRLQVSDNGSVCLFAVWRHLPKTNTGINVYVYSPHSGRPTETDEYGVPSSAKT